MTYGLVLCSLCKRPRVVDLGQKTSSCPYCNYSETLSKARCVYRSEDQEDVRAAMAQGSGADAEIPSEKMVAIKRRRIAEKDPHSTLVYRYEHASDMEERMTILSEGLMELMGEFSLDDMMEIAGPKAEKMLPAMLDRGFIYESRPGFYKV